MQRKNFDFFGTFINTILFIDAGEAEKDNWLNSFARQYSAGLRLSRQENTVNEVNVFHYSNV